MNGWGVVMVVVEETDVSGFVDTSLAFAIKVWIPLFVAPGPELGHTAISRYCIKLQRIIRYLYYIKIARFTKCK